MSNELPAGLEDALIALQAATEECGGGGEGANGARHAHPG